MKTYEVIIVDDHLLITRALATLVNSFENYTVKFTFQNGREFIDKLSSGMKEPDILLLDVKMPVMNGIETMKWLKKYHPDIKTLALSIEGEDKTILSMLRNGAKGYLLKDSNPTLLKKALDTIIEQGYFHTDKVSNVLLKSLNDEAEDKSQPVLKDLEIEFIKLVCQEYTYKEIADIMCKSHHTIDGYRQQLFEKLNVRNRIGLVMYALRNNIVAF